MSRVIHSHVSTYCLAVSMQGILNKLIVPSLMQYPSSYFKQSTLALNGFLLMFSIDHQVPSYLELTLIPYSPFKMDLVKVNPSDLMGSPVLSMT